MELGALILFTNRFVDAVAFYRALGAPLEEEEHDEGPVHYACEIGPVHFAIFEAAAGDVPSHRRGGSSMPGFAVPSAQQAFEIVEELGAKIVQPPSEYPWGIRFLVEDPDGRVVEVFERKR
jgi:predicted enzyme related to lactoylglutathione lyase